MPEPTKRRARHGEPLPGPSALVLRGDLFDPDEIGASAERNDQVYGFYGISVFAEVGGTTFDDIAATKLARARWIAVFTAGAVITAGRDRYWSWVRVVRVDPDGQVHFQQISAAEAQEATPSRATLVCAPRQPHLPPISGTVREPDTTTVGEALVNDHR